MSSKFSITRTLENIGNVSLSSLESISHLSIGQMILKSLDRFMGIIEKTAEWSLPYHEIATDENGKSFKEMELIRPLPWILFLPSLLILRAVRFAWNVGAYIIGYPEIQPSDIVRSLQKNRRRLRSIRVSGSKKIRKNRAPIRDKSLRINDAKRSLMKSIQLTLCNLSCLDASKMKSSPSPTRIPLYSNNNFATTPDEKSATESTIMNHNDSKRKYSTISSDDQSSDDSDQEETLLSKLERYAANSSDDENDADFDPTEYSSDSGESTEEEILDCNEVKSNHEDYVRMLKNEITEVKNELEFLKESNQQVESIEITTQIETIKATINSQKRINQRPEEQTFFSPNSVNDGDIEAEFYSPMSSKSTSPEPENVTQSVIEKDNEIISSNDSTTVILPIPSENGQKENHASTVDVISVIKEESIKNQPEENVELSTGKNNKQYHNHKGKRHNNHGHRKKK